VSEVVVPRQELVIDFDPSWTRLDRPRKALRRPRPVGRERWRRQRTSCALMRVISFLAAAAIALAILQGHTSAKSYGNETDQSISAPARPPRQASRSGGGAQRQQRLHADASAELLAVAFSATPLWNDPRLTDASRVVPGGAADNGAVANSSPLRGFSPTLSRDDGRHISVGAQNNGLATAALTPSRDMHMALPKDNEQLNGDNPLVNMTLRYLLGASSPGRGDEGVATVVAYDVERPVKHGVSIAYCNLFDETNSGDYGPYLNSSATAEKYNEGQIDPNGPGWEKNLREQFERRRRQGFEYVELDNPDAYAIEDVIGAIELARSYGLKVIAKNPGLMERGALAYVSHPNVYGMIVEQDAGSPSAMDALRRKAGKPNIPVWFVAFGSGRKWAEGVATTAKKFPGMGVTYSSAGEYGNAIASLDVED